jgi:DNA-binding PadR family transcriptional regulator
MIRMREPTYYVLASLADGPLPGYAIIKDAESRSDGQVRLTVGTLFSVLDRLSCAGHVRVAGAELVAGRIRTSYGITRSGLTSLWAEAARQAIAAGLVAQSAYGERINRIVTVGGRVRVGSARTT